MFDDSNPAGAPRAPVPEPEERGGGDHDQPYQPGHPKLLLSERELARLLILRGRVLDGELL